MLTLRPSATQSTTVYQATFDRDALWDPATIDQIINSFPKGYIPTSELFLLLAECIANAVLHGQAEKLILSARKRAQVLLMTFDQTPPMQTNVAEVLSMAKEGKITAPDLPGGLGFPILLRLVHHVTISMDYTRLQLWIRLKK